MKTCSLSVLTLSLALILPLHAAPAPIEIIVSNDDDPVFASPLRAEGPTLPSATFGAASLQPSLPALQNATNRTIMTALCAASSVSVGQSRLNAMAGLSGQATDTNSNHPAGWYVLPDGPTPVGLQWHHLITTAFPMWRGVVGTNLPDELIAERGGRLVLHSMGTGPVSQYTCDVMVTGITNIANTTFPIGKDSAGNKLRFNLNFPAIHRGENDVLESTRDPATGIWTVVGDDHVYTNGEDPDSSQYHVWYRFGATVSLTVGNPTAMEMVKDQFIVGSPHIHVNLIRTVNGTPQMVSAKTTAEAPSLWIEKDELEPATVSLYLMSGQDYVDHSVESKIDLNGEWEPIFLGIFVNFSTGIQFDMLDGNEFFRLKAVKP